MLGKIRSFLGVLSFIKKIIRIMNLKGSLRTIFFRVYKKQNKIREFTLYISAATQIRKQSEADGKIMCSVLVCIATACPSDRVSAFKEWVRMPKWSEKCTLRFAQHPQERKRLKKKERKKCFFLKYIENQSNLTLLVQGTWVAGWIFGKAMHSIPLK